MISGDLSSQLKLPGDIFPYKSDSWHILARLLYLDECRSYYKYGSVTHPDTRVGLWNENADKQFKYPKFIHKIGTRSHWSHHTSNVQKPDPLAVKHRLSHWLCWLVTQAPTGWSYRPRLVVTQAPTGSHTDPDW